MKAQPQITTWALILLLALALPAVYVASMGPVTRCCDYSTASTVYWPIIASCDETPLERPLCAYIEWWHSGGNQGHRSAFEGGRFVRWLSHIE